MIRRAVVALIALLATAGCTGGTPHTALSARPSPPPASPPSPTPGEQLAVLAAAVPPAYSASYAVRAPGAAATTIAVFRTPSAYRLDITSGGSTAVLISTGHGTVSCRLARTSRRCFAVAGPHRPVPALFEAGLERVFTSYLPALAADVIDYQVAAAGSSPPAGAVPAGQCFAVRSTPAARVQVAAGTYCLAEAGMLTRVVFPSGRMDLRRFSGPPSARVFVPPASAAPLPRG